MNLIRDKWTNKDVPEFQNYLLSLARDDAKREWESKITNTNLPTLAILSSDVDKIIKQIKKGNYISFIDLWIWEYFTDTTIIGNLIAAIKDFEVMKGYLIKYCHAADSWAHTDCVKFNITRKNSDKFYALAQELVNGEAVFIRRMGLIILLKLTNFEEYTDKILALCNVAGQDGRYYVSMANAWLVAECFIKSRDKTLAYLRNNNLDKFTQNKAISKCCDSFRVTKEDKLFLKTLRK